MEKRSTKSTTTRSKRSSSKRQRINTGRDKRFVRRSAKGQFKESDDVSRSLSQDRKRKAATKAKAGQGDRGDRKTTSRKTTLRKTSARRTAARKTTKSRR